MTLEGVLLLTFGVMLVLPTSIILWWVALDLLKDMFRKK